ncbi:peroxiredoxin [Nakamurella antarctica]|uniref:Alkyl hydroperoxide reductase E n=1 Tax=Nakamurella antarctica TaxID=1902245 RepID=A0A3G8ZLP6_9ACTN|nr:peroxiredoxin [Nakamurella antarctica]AZI58183.1 peroxiredoxin [Nakamurella antarctica]
MTVEVGTLAPEFTLSNQDGESVVLSSFRGKQAVLVVFYPFAFSQTCTGELCAIRDDLGSFQNDAIQVLAISVDAKYSLKAYAESQGYAFPLLADFWPHGAVAQQYGVFMEGPGMALRGTFLVDIDGVVRFAEVNGPGEARDQAAWKRAVAALSS